MYKVIGLDGGGTSTKGCIGYDKNNIIGKSIAGGLNPYVYEDNEIVNTLKFSINQLLIQADIKAKDVDILSIGGAGLDRIGDQLRFENIYKKTGFNIPLHLTNDAKILLAANITNEPGILTISGTGSIAYGSDGINYYRYGGYGHIIGDLGSGYDIGISALKKIFKENDNGCNISLKKIILDHLDLTDLDDLLSWIYDKTTRKQDIASIAKCIWNNGSQNEMVTEIFDTAAENIINLTTSLYKTMTAKGINVKKLMISGSILSKNDYVRSIYTKEIIKRTGMDYIDGNITAEVGALLLGLKKLNGEL